MIPISTILLPIALMLMLVLLHVLPVAIYALASSVLLLPMQRKMPTIVYFVLMMILAYSTIFDNYLSLSLYTILSMPTTKTMIPIVYI
jgi:hypothetical protein